MEIGGVERGCRTMGRTKRTCLDCKTAKVISHGGNMTTVVCNHNDIDKQRLFSQAYLESAATCDSYRAIDQSAGTEVRLPDALRYILAGKSEFTFLSLKTNVRIRYKLQRKVAEQKGKKGQDEYIYFLNTFTDGEYKYAGVLFYDDIVGQFKFGRGQRGLLNYSHINIKSLLFVLNQLSIENYNLSLKVYHAGKCGRCGRKLTTPESILTGLGPECSKKAGVPRVKIT